MKKLVSPLVILSSVLLLAISSLSGYSQHERIDSVKTALKNAASDTNKVKLLNRLCSLTFRYNGVDSNFYFKTFNESIELSKKLDYYRGEMFARLNAAQYCTNIGKYSYGRNILTEALKAAELKHDSVNIFNILYRTGGSYSQEGYYSIAAEYLYKSLVLAEIFKDKAKLSSVYNVLGNTYIDQKDCQKAVLYHLKALNIRKQLNDSLRISHSYVNLGISYAVCNKYDSATFYYSKALAIQTIRKNKVGQAYSYNGIGNCHLLKGNNVAAISYFKRANALLQEEDDINELITNLNFLGRAYLRNENLPEALSYYEKAKDLAERSNKLIELKESYSGLSELFELKGNFKDAHIYHKLYTAINDTLNNKETFKKVTSLEYKRQLDQENKIRELESEKIRISHELEVKKQRFVIITVLIVALIVLIMLLFILREYKAKKKANIIISKQKDEVENQKQLVEEKQKEILDSIIYAKQIQKALLAHHDFVDKHIPGNFIYFKPKDIVSGDFYWATKKGDYFYLAVCDSTGHGVPGAFMSLLNIGFLSEAINEKEITSPELVLNYVRERLIASISRENQKDGFDGILLKIQVSGNETKIEYAAANNAPVLISQGILRELEKDKMPVGKGERTESFTLYSIDVKKGDSLYLYTDGYADQFGGPKGKKFKYKPLNELLHEIHLLPAKEQESLLNKKFDHWKGYLEQVDDVCIIGVRL